MINGSHILFFECFSFRSPAPSAVASQPQVAKDEEEDRKFKRRREDAEEEEEKDEIKKVCREGFQLLQHNVCFLPLL